MDTRDWVTIGIAIFTLISSWGQFWVKERLFTDSTSGNDAALAIFRSKVGVSIIALTGVLSAASIWLLTVEIQSALPLTRFSCFFISGLTVLATLNLALVQSLFTLRKLAVFAHEMKRSQANLMAFAASHG